VSHSAPAVRTKQWLTRKISWSPSLTNFLQLKDMENSSMDAELESFPISPDSSALDALCSLNPPSPILTPSQVEFSWSIGEIPVLLYDDAYAEDSISLNSSIHDTSQISWATEQRNSVAKLHDVSVTGRHDSSSDRFNYDLTAVNVSTSLRPVTVCSTGTFGRHRESVPHPETPVLASFAPQAPPECISHATTAGVVSEQSRIVVNDAVCESDYRVNSVRGCSHTVVVHPPSLVVEGSHSTHSNSTIGALDGESSNLRSRFSVDTVELQASPTEEESFAEALPSAISWISSKDWDNKQYKDFLAQNAQLLLRTQESKAKSVDRASVLSSRSPIARQKALQTRDSHVGSPFSTPSPPRPRLVQNPSPTTPPRPIIQHNSEYGWLKKLTVHFLVDQEGFRDAQPTFNFSGLARLRSSPEIKTPDLLMAQFRPQKRQSFHFHYAPWDTPPILRRVTLNDDETHDYVSRQACLTLKCNGVYVVHGYDMVSGHHSASEAANGKLHWQFEYLVDERRADVSKTPRDMEGEKTLTPLTFSCTPELLVLAQAKKINIMHILRKGVAPKLVAEKLQPPGTISRPLPLGTARITNAHASSTLNEVRTSLASKAHGWHLHRRTHSHGVKQHSTNVELESHGQQIKTFEHTSDKKIMRGRHRRASSAGENMPPKPNGHVAQPTLRGQGNLHITGTTSSCVHHIVPPGRLSELLNSPPKNSKTPDRNTCRIRSTSPDRTSRTFVPLTPRPKYAPQHARSHARRPSATPF